MTQDLWQRYSETKDPQTREALILQYTPLVKYVIGRMAINIPSILDSDDIVAYGTIGLIAAVDRFDPQRGVKFQSYAIARIRGSILDALRSLNFLSRTATARIQKIEEAFLFLQQENQVAPTYEEVAAYLGMSLEKLNEVIQQSSLAFVSLESPLQMGNSEGENLSLQDMIEDPETLDPAAETEKRELRDVLAQALAQLQERDRLVLSLYYYEELTLREIGQVLGISESRVHQIHARAIIRLRSVALMITEGVPLTSAVA